MPDPKLEPSLSHVDAAGTPRMVDISEKGATVRTATAAAKVLFPLDVLAALRAQSWNSAKGAVLHTAIVAGTQAAKRTPELIPFCHSLPLDACTFEVLEREDGLELRCTAKTTYRTGVEMEAFTGVTVAALTVIDMCKAATPALCITDVWLVQKTGGKTEYQRP